MSQRCKIGATGTVLIGLSVALTAITSFNKVQSDFDSLFEYNNYLEEVEDISEFVRKKSRAYIHLCVAGLMGALLFGSIQFDRSNLEQYFPS